MAESFNHRELKQIAIQFIKNNYPNSKPKQETTPFILEIEEPLEFWYGQHTSLYYVLDIIFNERCIISEEEIKNIDKEIITYLKNELKNETTHIPRIYRQKVNLFLKNVEKITKEETRIICPKCGYAETYPTHYYIFKGVWKKYLCGRADVFDPNNLIIVECGNKPSEWKIQDYINPKINKFYWVNYKKEIICLN